ncbi:MAG: fumarate reductase subunit FrdD [Betaproteobacteria bacterium]|nr:MAG: fumarate reductase subunit FrdD [Betaproteobacteria bacterium]
MKRSNEPIFWSMFGAGGMLAALIGPALVIITGIAVPFGLFYAPDTMSYANMLAFAHNWLGKIFIFAVVALFLWHAAHRIAILLHDFGVHAVALVKLITYGGAFVGTVIVAYALLRL